MKFNEFEWLPYNWKTQDCERKIGTVELSPFSIEDIMYNIPPKIFNKSFVLKYICMNYMSDSHKVTLTQEKTEYPLILTESRETVTLYNWDHDLFLTEFGISKTGKGYVRISLYEEGKANPIKIVKFKPWRIMYNPNKEYEWWAEISYDSLKAGKYFLLFDNIKANLDEFNKYESLIGPENDILFKWHGRESFAPSHYLSNGMLVLPFRIEQNNLGVNSIIK